MKTQQKEESVEGGAGEGYCRQSRIHSQQQPLAASLFNQSAELQQLDQILYILMRTF